jgi:hypothetical protein
MVNSENHPGLPQNAECGIMSGTSKILVGGRPNADGDEARNSSAPTRSFASRRQPLGRFLPASRQACEPTESGGLFDVSTLMKSCLMVKDCEVVNVVQGEV